MDSRVANITQETLTPIVRQALDQPKDEIMSIWGERERFCAALAGLPQTLCHNDVFRRNLFHNEKSTKLIDWALAGRGAVGEELVCFVALSLYFPEIPLSQAEARDQAIFAGYVDGLRDVGWTGDARSARLGYTCAMTLLGLAGVKQDVTLLIDESNHAFHFAPPQRSKTLSSGDQPQRGPASVLFHQSRKRGGVLWPAHRHVRRAGGLLDVNFFRKLIDKSKYSWFARN